MWANLMLALYRSGRQAEVRWIVMSTPTFPENRFAGIYLLPADGSKLFVLGEASKGAEPAWQPRGRP